MMQIAIRKPDASEYAVELTEGSYLAGAAADCNIVLDSPAVSGYHALLVVRGGEISLQDLKSSNGTFVNGVELKPDCPQNVIPGDSIRFGNVSAVLQKKRQEPPLFANQSRTEHCDGGKVPVMYITGVSETDRPLLQEIKKQAHRELLSRLNLKKLALSGASEEMLREKAVRTIAEIINSLTIPLPPSVTRSILEKELLMEAVGLGPLEYLTGMDGITEIMVNGAEKIYVEKNGVIYRTDASFADDDQVLLAIERIVSPLGRRIDESSPMVDARLPDGSRVNAIIPPLALGGPTVTIRKFSRRILGVADLVNSGSVSRNMVDFLEVCVALRKNILISGGTGSGKTTLLNALSSFIPDRDRIITIEDSAELQLRQEHLVRLEARPANIEGRGEISIRDLVRNALRMRPDRIVVGECRGGEALDMLQAMNTGHNGSLTTIHANSPRDALARLETLVLMAGFELPLRAIREQVALAIDIVVQVSREKDGSRRITGISEITRMEGEVITMQELFAYRHTGWSSDGRMQGYFAATGTVPSFWDEVERAGIPLDIGIFKAVPGGEHD